MKPEEWKQKELATPENKFFVEINCIFLAA
jgi:hypothetical protein